ncbi:MAG: beta strand repeat-containing protein, partial [Leptolyngbyaceae cyanobacterium]
MSLNPGDIGFVQYNADETQSFAFVTLVEIAANEEIHFTDRGWLSNNSGFSNNAGDGTITWVTTEVVAAGTVITISGSTASVGSINTSLFELSTGGDQILAYQGTDTAPAFIAAINNDNQDGTNPYWDGVTISQNTSARPQGLSDGINSVSIDEVDNAKYNGSILTGDRSTLLLAINDKSNWTRNDTTTQTFSGPFNVTGGADNVKPTHLLNTLTPGDGDTDVATGEALAIGFNEAIQKGTGNIYIKNADNNSVADTIDVTSNQVNISGATVTIDLTNNLAKDQSYYVQIDNGAFKDLSGNTYVGINDTTTWDFKTAPPADPNPPEVTGYSTTGVEIDINDNLTLTFNEAVKTATGNITIYKADGTLLETIDVTTAQVTVSNTIVTINPTTPLTYTTNYYVQIDNEAIQDLAGNNYAGISNTTTWSFTTLTPDTTPPSVDIQGEPAWANNTTTPYPVTFQFSEDVTGFEEGDIVVTNGTIGNFQSTNASTYTADITPNGNGNITIDVAAGVAQDAAGNANTVASQATTTYDATAPTVAIQNAPLIGNQAPFTVTFEFNEDVTGFEQGDITVGNGSVGPVTTVDAHTYTAEITPDGNGDITINVAAGVAQDAAGNSNTVAPQATTTYDGVAPTVDILNAPATGNQSSFTATFEFSEDVTGFEQSDITVGNGSVGPITTVDAHTYTAEITPDGNGDITINVFTNVAQDAAGNGNTAATPVTTTYDGTVPTVAIQNEHVTSNQTPFTVTFEFSEDVTGFAQGDITVGNGSVGPITTVDAHTYTAEITPNGNGNITIDVAANAAQDAAGNGNTTAPQASITYDATAPTVAIQNTPATSNTSSFIATFEFSETVTDFEVGDINVTNGGADTFTAIDGNTYTAQITPDGNGNIAIDVAANAAQDAAGNGNTVAPQASVTYDGAVPTVAIQDTPTTSSTSPFTVTFQFSETVTGFEQTDIAVGNGNVSNFQATDADTYTAEITPDGNGNITINVLANAAQDAAGNNSEAAQDTITYDGTLPTVTIQNAPPFVNTLTAYPVTFEFSEVVTEFVQADITVSNGSVSNFGTTDNITYNASITPNGHGNITIDVAAGVAQDESGNGNTVATQVITNYDGTVPTVDIQNEPTTSNLSSFTVTFEFSEAVTGFEVGDISVTYGSAGTFTPIDANTYTAQITPDGNGDIVIDVATGVAQDAAGNGNTQTQATVTYDGAAPTVDIQDEPTVSNLSPFTVTFEFSEDVTGFGQTDIVVGNGSAGTFQVIDAKTYTAEITPDGNGDITINVAGGVAQDAAGNGNTQAQATTTYDGTAPTVAIQNVPGTSTQVPFTVTFEFSEDVTGFEQTDIVVGNGSVGTFTEVSAQTYTAEITPDGNGDITIDVAADVAQDTAGNGNVVAPQATSTYDIPVVTGFTPSDDGTDVAVDANLSIQFNEDIQLQTGNITLYDAADNVIEAIDVTDNSLVSASDNIVTINPSQDLERGQSYYLMVDEGAIADLA